MHIAANICHWCGVVYDCCVDAPDSWLKSYSMLGAFYVCLRSCVAADLPGLNFQRISLSNSMKSRSDNISVNMSW